MTFPHNFSEVIVVCYVLTYIFPLEIRDRPRTISLTSESLRCPHVSAPNQPATSRRFQLAPYDGILWSGPLLCCTRNPALGLIENDWGPPPIVARDGRPVRRGGATGQSWTTDARSFRLSGSASVSPTGCMIGSSRMSGPEL